MIKSSLTWYTNSDIHWELIRPIRGRLVRVLISTSSTWLSLPSFNSSPTRCGRHLVSCLQLFHMTICLVFPCLLRRLDWRLEELHAATLVLRWVLRGVDERRIVVLPSVTPGVTTWRSCENMDMGFWCIFVRTKSALALHDRESCVGIEESDKVFCPVCSSPGFGCFLSKLLG